MMEDRLGDLLHCEEQLRNTLHSNDKEKLRRKLALLQREYLRTAQKLKRAEHMDSVRKHVRSKITQHNQHDQTKADIKPSSSSVEPDGTKRTLTGTVKNQQLSPGRATAIDNNTQKRTQMIRFALLPDTAYTPTSDSSQDSAQISRASPALRLRSRRSRLRWEKKSAESDQSAANSQEAPEKTGRMEEQETHTNHFTNAPVLHESEELFSPSENDSPSLLLPHWNLQGQAETGESKKQPLISEKGINISNSKEKRSNSPPLLLEAKDVTPLTDNSPHSKLADSCEKGKEHIEDKAQQIQTEISLQNATEMKVETQEDGSKRLLDSCTLVEGLLFPAEYYVRTTRRMAVSQSQPDMNAIILSHLVRGRQRRSRGRGRKLHRTVSDDASQQNGQNNESILEPLEASKNVSENDSPSSCGFPNGISLSLDVCSSSRVRTPGRGRRGRRGRGRGRGRTPGRTPSCLRHEEDTRTADISVALSPPKLCLSSEEAVTDSVQSEGTNGAATNSTVNEAQTSSGASNVQKICPIFLKTNRRSTNYAQKNTASSDWRSLLLPSSSPAQNGLLSLPSFTPIPLLKNLLSSDIQDFHLPDDQFASLKLLKLRHVTSGVEQFTSPSYNTRSNNRYASSPAHIFLSPCPTPDITHSASSKLVQDVLILQNDCLDSVTSHECEAKLDVSELLGQEKQDVCPSPEILNSVSPTECEVVTNVLSSLDSDSNLAKSSNEPQVSKFSINGDAGSMNLKTTILGKEKQGLDSVAQSESNVVQKIISASENSPKNCSEAKAENIQIMKETDPKLESVKSCLTKHKAPSQLLLSPSLDSASCPLTLPLVGFTPHPIVTSPRTPSPLALPPAHSPTSEALSPPALSPCPSLRSLPPSLPPASPSHLCQGQCEAPAPREPSQRGHPESQQGATVQREDDGKLRSCTYTLKAPAGGTLVDVCCLLSSSGSLCVAAAGKWAVCLWNRAEPSDWSLTHTWTFNEPVISVFPVPDAPDLFCVTLGQLEIREVRMLSCSRPVQTVLCDGVIQTVIGVPKSRVVSSSQTTATSILRVFTLSDDNSSPDCHPLVSPGGSIGSLAPVEGLPDALLGTDESGSLLIWNLKTGHLLQKVTLGDSLSHSVCLRGYSYSGVLFVLMQHHFLGSLKELEDGLETEKVENKTALFSLVAVNPRNGKSALATPFYQPKFWCGRLCEADVLGSSLVGLSQRGSVCVWDLEHPRDPRAVLAPESEGWQLARWGGHNVLLTALHTGDVTLHYYGHTPGLLTALEDTWI